jgi:hypothetical protein
LTVHLEGHVTLFPLQCAIGLSSLFIKKIEFENGEKSSITSSFAICPCYEEPSFASFEGGVDRVLGGMGINNMPSNSKNSLIFFVLACV